jgi:hypothetical protein
VNTIGGPTQRDRNIRTGAVIAVAVAAAFLVWLLFIQGDDSSSGGKGGQGAAALGKPVILSEGGLKALSGTIGQPIYWAGERPGTHLEVTQQKNGNVLVRYLPTDVDAGEPAQKWLTIGTYPFSDAYGGLQVVAKRPGAQTAETPSGGLVVTNESTPTSVYVAYPDVDFEIEIYSPNPDEALSVAKSDALQPIA